MSGHPQNSPRGLFWMPQVQIGARTVACGVAGDLTIDGALTASGVVTGSGVTIGSLAITANSTCIKFPTRTALPNTRQVGGIAFVVNSTLRSLAFWSTGTTWVYCDGTT